MKLTEIKDKFCRWRECRKPFKPYKTTDDCCSSPCKISYENEKKEAKAERQKETQGQNRKQLFELAKITVNAFVRAEAIANKVTKCFCCDKPLGVDFQAGHGFTGGASSNTVLDLDNIRPQRKECNEFNAGNRTEFLRRLEIDLGSDRFNVLREEAYKEKRWDSDELRRIIEHYKRQTKILQNK